MLKKYLPHILIAAGVIVLLIMMGTISNKDRLGIPLLHPKIIIQAVVSILLMTFGISLLLKRL